MGATRELDNSRVTTVTEELLLTPNLDQRKLVGIDGNWYDVTNFIPHHPGGAVIEHFVGKDATAVFHAFHKSSVLKYRKPFSKMKSTTVENDQICKDFAQLGQYFEEKGYFETNYFWYAGKFLLTFVLFISFLAIITNYAHSNCVYFGALILGLFWQQCGFFMHDFGHNQLTHDRHVDKWFALFFGTFCFGSSSTLWRDEHFVHHAVTTCVDYTKSFSDPQMTEPVVWAQHQKLWPFYQSKLAYVCVKIQHFTFLPLCIIMGRVSLMTQSITAMTKPVEWIAFILHWVWVISIFHFTLPTGREIAMFYGITTAFQGILHVTLLANHYPKSFHNIEDVSSKISWYEMQIESNLDLDVPWWMDWFHGGLNYHLVHHFYPRMPRHNYRRATEHVKRVCKEHNLPYDHCGWFEAVYRTLKTLKTVSALFTLTSY